VQYVAWRHSTLGLLAYIDFGLAVGMTGETHLVARQFREIEQTRTGLRKEIFHHLVSVGVPDAIRPVQ
jgi:hypothetical protein